VCRHILASGYPYAGATSRLNGNDVAVHEAAVVSPDRTIVNRTPGKIVSLREGRPIVVCGRGLLEIHQMSQSDGTNALPVRSVRQRFG
jgi:methionyl-tRNA formyltransferase